MITLEQYWMGRDATHGAELTDELRANAAETVRLANVLCERYEQLTGMLAPTYINSGWRPKSINAATPGAATGSKHLTCRAVDLDDNGPFDRWCMEHPEILAEVGLWQEHPGWTNGWCHLQIVPPGNPPRPEVRTFIPSSAPPQTTIYGRAPVIYPVGVA